MESGPSVDIPFPALLLLAQIAVLLATAMVSLAVFVLATFVERLTGGPYEKQVEREAEAEAGAPEASADLQAAEGSGFVL